MPRKKRHLGECTDSDCDGDVYQRAVSQEMGGAGGKSSTGTNDPGQQAGTARCEGCGKPFGPPRSDHLSGVEHYIAERDHEPLESVPNEQIEWGQGSVSRLDSNFFARGTRIDDVCTECGEQELTLHAERVSFSFSGSNIKGVPLTAVWGENYGENGDYIECENCGTMYKSQNELIKIKIRKQKEGHEAGTGEPKAEHEPEPTGQPDELAAETSEDQQATNDARSPTGSDGAEASDGSTTTADPDTDPDNTAESPDDNSESVEDLGGLDDDSPDSNTSPEPNSPSTGDSGMGPSD